MGSYQDMGPHTSRVFVTLTQRAHAQWVLSNEGERVRLAKQRDELMKQCHRLKLAAVVRAAAKQMSLWGER